MLVAQFRLSATGGPVSSIYSPASRLLQDRFDTRRLADRLEDVKVHTHFTDDDRAFITQMDMCILATVDATGQPTCSYKGGDPGFVRVLDDNTLALPDYDGNGMFLTMGNVSETGRVGMLFLDFVRQRRMRVDGTAILRTDADATSAFPGAQLVLVVRAERIYPNCPRYLHKYELVERSAFVPRTGSEAPIPAWKQSEWARDVLPKREASHNDGP